MSNVIVRFLSFKLYIYIKYSKAQLGFRASGFVALRNERTAIVVSVLLFLPSADLHRLGEGSIGNISKYLLFRLSPQADARGSLFRNRSAYRRNNRPPLRHIQCGRRLGKQNKPSGFQRYARIFGAYKQTLYPLYSILAMSGRMLPSAIVRDLATE